jgi:hypothetical protein
MDGPDESWWSLNEMLENVPGDEYGFQHVWHD